MISIFSIDLEKGFSLFLLVIGVQLDVELLNQLLCLVFLEVHDGIKHLQNDKKNNMKVTHYCVSGLGIEIVYAESSRTLK